MMENKKNIKKLIFNNKGFAAFYVAIVVLIIMLGIALSLIFLVVNQQKILSNSLTSYKSFSAAEAGIEDALLRLTKGMNWSSPYNLTLGTATSTVEISDIIGGSRTITSTGNINNRIRKVQVSYQIVTNAVSFHYGAQVGEGGMTTGNNKSKVFGNVFSNGNVTGPGEIANDVIIAGNTHKLDGLTIGGNATVHSCYNAKITGTLSYVTGGSIVNCDYFPPAVDLGTDEIEPIPLPISPGQINDWKIEAEKKGGIVEDNVTISGTQSLGPIQIGTPGQPKNLTVSNNATLNITGIIYVTGNITTGTTPATTVKLDASYGSFSGVIVADGSIVPGNNTNLTGSGQAGSYLLLLSTKSGAGAIAVGNNALGAIFYTSNGGIILSNNVKVREVTGYQLTLSNNAEIRYEIGLKNLIFSNGPGGSWQVASWKEIE